MFTWTNASTVQIKSSNVAPNEKKLFGCTFLFIPKIEIPSKISISRNYLFLKSANNPQQTGSTLATLILQSTWEINGIIW